MPGVLGIVGSPEGQRVDARFSAMRTAMERGGRLVSETRVADDQWWALGRVHLAVLHPAPQLRIESSIQVLFHGDLENETELRTDLERAGVPPPSDIASLLAALYHRHGPRFARSLKGVFCAVLFDEPRRQLLLISDRLGSYPIYWCQTGDAIVFASELRAAVRAHPRPELNPQAVSDLLKFAFPMGNKTLAQGVDLLPASAILTYNAQDHTVAIERYATLAESFRPTESQYSDYLDGIERGFDRAARRSIVGAHRYGLSLSGGLDTRVILSALDRLHQPVSTFTLGGKGCADEVIAYELARMARSRHRFVALDDEYLGDLLPTVKRMVSLTDGMYVTHGFTEMLALQSFEESECSVLLRGHGGELAKASTAWPLHTDARIFQMTSTEEFIPYLLTRLTHVSRGESSRELFTDAWTEAIAGGPRSSLEQSLDGVQLRPADLCSYLYLHEYHRRVSIPSLEIFRNAVEVRLPLADIEFIESVVQGPAEWRDGTKIHQALVARNNAAYLRVRNPNTGAPAGAGPFQEAILDKLNTVLRRLNVYGYRHYHSFDGWMRRAFLDIVERVLLGRDAMARQVFRENIVRQRVDEARKGVQEHDDLLQALVTVELWQQENL